MDRLTSGIIIAAAALLMTGGLSTDVFAREPAAEPAVQTPAAPQPVPPARGGRVLGLILALDALRLSPTLLDPQKV